MSTKQKEHPLGCHPQGSLCELNSSRSSRASTERPFVEFANWILLHFVRRTASSARVARTKKDRHPIGCLSFFGGATQIRTGGRGVADLCLTTWPWRHIYLTDKLDHKISELSRGFVSLFVKVWLLVILERLRLARHILPQVAN